MSPSLLQSQHAEDATAWVVRLSAKTQRPAVRLLCIPHAGGNPRSFAPWIALLPKYIELTALESPGHGSKLAREPLRDIEAIASRVSKELMLLPPCPTAIFGHSVGALVALEVVRSLAMKGAAPTHLFVAGACAPSSLRHNDLSSLSDDQLRVELSHLNGFSPEVLRSQELMMLLMPSLRADLSLIETYQYRPHQMSCPITVFTGADDPETTHGEVMGWEAETSAMTHFINLPGDHFFVTSDLATLVTEIVRALGVQL